MVVAAVVVLTTLFHLVCFISPVSVTARKYDYSNHVLVFSITFSVGIKHPQACFLGENSSFGSLFCRVPVI